MKEQQMVVGDNFCTRCKRVRCKRFESIPDELLFAIMSRLQAQDIYFGARFVCRKWYHMTRTQYFISAHLEHAMYGLLYAENITKGCLFHLPEKIRRGIDKYKLLNYEITGCPSWPTCNGLVLEYYRKFYYVTNVSTGQAFRLPPCPPTLYYQIYSGMGYDVEYYRKFYYVTNVSTGQAFRLPPCPPTLYYQIYSGMGYDVASMTYKVVILLYDKDTRRYGYGIVTMGVDKSWRSVRIDHLSILASETIRGHPIGTEGFLVWINCWGTKVVTLNLETEIMTEASPPFALLQKERHTWPPSVLLEEEKHKRHVHFMPTGGRYLTYFLRRGSFQWEVFEIEPKTVEWRKMCNICLEGQKDRIEMLVNIQRDEIDIRACGWLKYPDVLALRVRKPEAIWQEDFWQYMIFYNILTCEIGAEKVTTSIALAQVSLHKNSLLRLDGPL